MHIFLNVEERERRRLHDVIYSNIRRILMASLMENLRSLFPRRVARPVSSVCLYSPAPLPRPAEAKCVPCCVSKVHGDTVPRRWSGDIWENSSGLCETTPTRCRPRSRQHPYSRTAYAQRKAQESGRMGIRSQTKSCAARHTARRPGGRSTVPLADHMLEWTADQARTYFERAAASMFPSHEGE